MGLGTPTKTALSNIIFSEKACTDSESSVIMQHDGTKMSIIFQGGHPLIFFLIHLDNLSSRKAV